MGNGAAMAHNIREIFAPEADGLGVNPSREPTIADLVAARMSRRTALKGMVAAAGRAWRLVDDSLSRGNTT
jgi:hypothetical protein